jgi:hypothetical protein
MSCNRKVAASQRQSSSLGRTARLYREKGQVFCDPCHVDIVAKEVR